VTLRLSGSASEGSLCLLVTLGSEDAGCQEDVLPLPRWIAISTASANLADTADSIPCTYSAGAAAPRTAVFTSSGVDDQVYCLFQVWQGGPLCSGVSRESGYSVFLAVR
jgi:hypothetical protein